MEEKLIEEILVEYLKQEGLTVSTAESCTGGLVAAKIINVSGVSKVYHAGFITYANEAKIEYLGVRSETIEHYGVVSGETVEEMAEGCAKAAGADLAITTSGVAGPDGGTKETPVGLVWFGIYYKGQSYSISHIFSGNRLEIRTLAADFAIKFALDIIKK